jgi:hypothetical protein
MDHFGHTDPKLMPEHFFSGAVSIDYKSAIRANTAIQNCGVAPRHWYLDARFCCRDCKSEFTWTAYEQKNWFERDRFHTDSKPKHCRNCRAKRREALRLRKEYDALVAEARTGGNWEQKQQIMRIVDELEAVLGRVPRGLCETRELFLKQLARRDATE